MTIFEYAIARVLKQREEEALRGKLDSHAVENREVVRQAVERYRQDGK